MTKRAKSSFIVNQYPTSHQSWIGIGLGDSEPGMTTDLLGFGLKPGTTFEQVKETAKCLNEYLEVLTVTKVC